MIVSYNEKKILSIGYQLTNNYTFPMAKWIINNYYFTLLTILESFPSEEFRTPRGKNFSDGNLSKINPLVLKSHF